MADVVTAPARSRAQRLLEGPHPHAHPQEERIPIWTGTECKVLGGVSRATTCAEVVRLLVAPDEDPAQFVIVEKWRKMERRLEPSVRILKVWQEWGDQQGDVTLILRALHAHAMTASSASANDGYIDKRGCSGRLLRRKSGHHLQAKATSVGLGTAAAALDPSPAARGTHVQRSPAAAAAAPPPADEGPLTSSSMERILSLVLTQGETIQTQLRKLRLQEEQIERYEEQMHRIRSLKDGENYVVDSYLSDDARGPSHAATTAGAAGNSTAVRLFGLGKAAAGSSSSLKRRDKGSGGKKEKAGKKRGGKRDIAVEGLPRLLREQLQLSPARVRGMDEIVAATAEEDEGDSFSAACRSEEPHVHSPTAGSGALLEQKELMERICEVNGELTKEEERLVKLGLKIRKYQQPQQPAMSAGSGGADGGGGEGEESSDEDDSEGAAAAEERQFATRLSFELEALRRITAEQCAEIEQNEVHLTEIEALLDEKHDCIVHLTQEIQLLDMESDQLQQRLLQINSQQQQPQPPPYEQALTSSMLANFLFPHGHAIDAVDAAVAKSTPPPPSCPRGHRPLVKAAVAPNGPCACACGCGKCNGSANYCQYPPTPTATIPAHANSASDPRATAPTTTEFNLHSDDSNSDTGISSLHSSGDENAPSLFGLDTLV